MISNTISLGFIDNTNLRLLPWRNSNGILLAGVSGYGKSTTAAFLLSQYAYNGTKMLICDYGASSSQSETLINNIDYLEPSFLADPAFDGKDIVKVIERAERLGNDRMSGKIPAAQHYPIMVVIDEFATFCINNAPPDEVNTVVSGSKYDEGGETRTVTKAPTYLDLLIGSILRFRKVNIHYMLISQEWASMASNSVRKLRSNMTDKICHRLDKNLSNLFFEDTKEKRACMALPVGKVLYNGDVLTIPTMTDSVVNAVSKRTREYERLRI